MGWNQVIEYVDAEVYAVAEVIPRSPVRKQVWNGERFVPITLYRIKGYPGMAAENWLLKNFGHAGIHRDGRYWDYSSAGDFMLMDEKVYTWYQMKWGNR
jgi:hypothetical protein